MSTQPEALRLANALEKYWGAERGHDRERQAAAELRRLHAEVEELRGALDEAMWHVKYKELKAVNESDTALLRQALEALEWHIERGAWGQDLEGLTAALRERLGEKT
jgi:hypothetical protein